MMPIKTVSALILIGVTMQIATAMDALDDCLDDIANSQDNGGLLVYSPTAKATQGLIHSCNGDDLDGFFNTERH